MIEFIVNTFWWTGQSIRNNLLHLSLKEVIDSLSQLKGTFPLRVDNLFASKLRPTLVLFDLKILNVVCLEVKI